MIQPYAVHPMRSVFSPTTLPQLPTFLHEDVVVGSYLPAIAYKMASDSLLDSVLSAGIYAFAHSPVHRISASASTATLNAISLAGDEDDVELDEELDDEDLDEEEDEDDFDEIEEDIDEEDLEGLEEEFEDEEFDEEEDDDLDDEDDDDLDDDIAEDDDL